MDNGTGAFIEKEIKYLTILIDTLCSNQCTIDMVQDSAQTVTGLIDNMKKVIAKNTYQKYEEFFGSLHIFCERFVDSNFVSQNIDQYLSSLKLFLDCVEEIRENTRVCNCCGKKVFYEPLSSYYKENAEKFHSIEFVAETLSEDEYTCPNCYCSDRDRMIINFLQQAGIVNAKSDTRLLQIAPSLSIENWIKSKCPQVWYESTDLFMENVSFCSDIQNMDRVEDETYDIIICSHVLEHVQDDKKALCELKRILKKKGMLVFLVPIALNFKEIDEEWGLSESENWKRFGQGDHCRVYAKEGLLSRISECGFAINELGEEYFGEETFKQLGLTHTSKLYVLVKDKDVDLAIPQWEEQKCELVNDGPLVSVTMSAYNHGVYVGEAIESVLNQTYKNVEFLVADDGSSDDTVEQMKKYSENFAKEYYFEENKGGRLDILVEVATGKYIANMNSDDIWDKDKLAAQVAYMEQHDDVMACFTWCDYTDEDLNVESDHIFYQRNRNRYEWMEFFWENGNALCHPSILIRREEYIRLINRGCCSRQLPDFFMWVDLVQHHEIYVVPKILTYMRRFFNSTAENTSSITKETSIRGVVENAVNWFFLIDRMDSDYFVKAFHKKLVRQDAAGEMEASCEKFFLFLNSGITWIQTNAMYYFVKAYENTEFRDCMKEKYSYTMKDFWKDIVNKGYASIWKD